MNVEGFREFLQSQRIEPRSIQNYLKVTGIVERDLARLTGKGLDEAGAEDLRKCFADYGGRLKEKSFNFYMIGARRYLIHYRGRRELEETLKTRRSTKAALPRFLKEGEVKKMIQAADNLRDKLIVELLWETGCRPGELLNLRIRDVGFDQYSAIVSLNGKSGERITRVFVGKPDLVEYLNHHPRGSDPEARLITTNDTWRRPLGERRLNEIIEHLGEKALRKHVNPYQFRHGCFTEKSKFYTDRELMILGGWRSPSMISTYSHLNLKDVDDKTLQLHGLKPPEKQISRLIEVRKCECGEDNAPFSLYCRKCSKPLKEELSAEKIIANREEFLKLAKAFQEFGFIVKREQT